MKINFAKSLLILAIIFSMSCNHGTNQSNNDKPNNDPPKPSPKDPTIKLFTVWEKDVINGSVLIPTDKTEVKKGNIKLEFNEEDAPKEFNVSPETITLAKEGDKETIVVSIEATEKYSAKNFPITVIRSSGTTGEKTIEECIASLGDLLKWHGTTIEEDIILPSTVAGFEGSSLVWKSSDEKVCTSSGKITKDLDDVEVTLTAEVSFKNKKAPASFKVTVGRIKMLTKKKDVNGKPYVYKLDFSTKGTLIISEGGKEKSKHEVKNIDVKTKHVTLILKETLDGNDLISVTDIFNKDKNRYIVLTEAQFGTLYKKFIKADSIEWNEFKKYIIEIDKAESYNGISSVNTDEEVFDYVHSRYDKFGESWIAFQAFDLTKKTEAIKGFLTWFRNYYASIHDFKNVTEDNIFALLSEERELIAKYKLLKFSSSKICTYVLKTTEDLTTYPEGYRFLATAVYDSSKGWNEQHGDYYTEKTATVKLIMEAGHIMKDGRLVARLIYEDSDENMEVYRGTIESNIFMSRYEGKEYLRVVLNDTKDQILNLNITTDGILKGSHNLKFVADAIGFKD